MRALTDIAVRRLKPSSTRQEIPDTGCRGLYLIVQPSGARGFAVRYRLTGISRKLTLPPGISLAGARKLAADAMFEVAQGRDPAAAKRAAQQTRAGRDTFQAIAMEYLRREGLRPEEKQLRSLKWREQVLRRHVYPALGDRPITEIRRSEIVRLLDKVEEGSGATMADRTLAIVRLIMNWHATRSDDFRSPIVRGMTRVSAEERARARILSDDELRAVWKTAAQRQSLFDYLVQFLLLTAARKNEAARMTWAELSGAGEWVLPAKRNKTKAELVRPLSTAAQDVLAALPRIAGSAFVFTADGGRALGGFTRRKQQFDARCGVSNWTVHDLRRSARSLLSRAGIGADIAERCLGHTIGGVRGVYDRHQYREEMRHAYEAVAGLMEHIINPKPNVVTLRN
jgi:integrase